MLQHTIIPDTKNIQPILPPADHSRRGAKVAPLRREICLGRLPLRAVPILIVVRTIGSESDDINAVGGPGHRSDGACERHGAGRRAKVFPRGPLTTVPDYVEEATGLGVEAEEIKAVHAPRDGGWSGGKLGVAEGLPFAEPGGAVPVLMFDFIVGVQSEDVCAVGSPGYRSGCGSEVRGAIVQVLQRVALGSPTRPIPVFVQDAVVGFAEDVDGIGTIHGSGKNRCRVKGAAQALESSFRGLPYCPVVVLEHE